MDNLMKKSQKKDMVIEQPLNQTTAIITTIERMACNPSVDIEKLERMLVMQEKVLDREARMAYSSAMAAAQGEFPIIPKNGKIVVKGVLRSKYSTYEDVKAATAPILSKYNLSTDFKPITVDGRFTVRGCVRHSGGHEEVVEMPLPMDTSGAKNEIQSVGSTISFGMRYCIKMLLDVASSEHDDDGQATSNDKVQELVFQRDRLVKMGVAIRENLPSIKCISDSIASQDWSTAWEAWVELGEEVQNELWIAPSKGGPFTTEEFRVIKTELRQKAMADGSSGEYELGTVTDFIAGL